MGCVSTNSTDPTTPLHHKRQHAHSLAGANTGRKTGHTNTHIYSCPRMGSKDFFVFVLSMRPALSLPPPLPPFSSPSLPPSSVPLSHSFLKSFQGFLATTTWYSMSPQSMPPCTTEAMEPDSVEKHMPNTLGPPVASSQPTRRLCMDDGSSSSKVKQAKGREEEMAGGQGHQTVIICH